MIKAILAIDDNGGVSKDGSMPWPNNSKDLKWFQRHTRGDIVVMGRTTWTDPKMPSPLPGRLNVLATSQIPSKFPGADMYINGDLHKGVEKIKREHPKKTTWIIGGPNIVNQLFFVIEEFYITRIYGNYLCDTFLDLNRIEREMNLKERIESDNTCHFEIWKK